MVEVFVDNKKELVTFFTTLRVDGRNLELSITKYLGYQSKDDLEKPIFEKVFYWSEELYTNPVRNHIAYRTLVETDYYNRNDNKYEVQWYTKSKI